MYKISIVPYFEAQLKKYKKRFPHIANDVFKALNTINLIIGPISIGKGLYKIRVASRDTNIGKSGGFRLVIYVKMNELHLIPVALFFKSDLDNMPRKELQKMYDIVNSQL